MGPLNSTKMERDKKKNQVHLVDVDTRGNRVWSTGISASSVKCSCSFTRLIAVPINTAACKTLYWFYDEATPLLPLPTQASTQACNH